MTARSPPSESSAIDCAAASSRVSASAPGTSRAERRSAAPRRSTSGSAATTSGARGELRRPTRRRSSARGRRRSPARRRRSATRRTPGRSRYRSPRRRRRPSARPPRTVSRGRRGVGASRCRRARTCVQRTCTWSPTSHPEGLRRRGGQGDLAGRRGRACRPRPRSELRRGSSTVGSMSCQRLVPPLRISTPMGRQDARRPATSGRARTASSCGVGDVAGDDDVGVGVGRGDRVVAGAGHDVPGDQGGGDERGADRDGDGRRRSAGRGCGASAPG